MSKVVTDVADLPVVAATLLDKLPPVRGSLLLFREKFLAFNLAHERLMQALFLTCRLTAPQG